MKKYSKITHILLAMLLCLAVAVLIPLSAVAANGHDAYANGNAAYRAADYHKAITFYEEALRTSPSAAVYYNLGNSYYRIGNNTKALLNFERAQRMSPSNEDISHNIDIARGRTTDRLPPDNPTFIEQWFHSLIMLLPLDAWAMVGISLLLLAVLLFATYMFMDNTLVTAASLRLSILAVICAALVNIFAWREHVWLTTHDTAIIIKPAVAVKASPTRNASNAFTIHEGTKVSLTDTEMAGWYAIRLSDGREGWIERNNVEQI